MNRVNRNNRLTESIDGINDDIVRSLAVKCFIVVIEQVPFACSSVIFKCYRPHVGSITNCDVTKISFWVIIKVDVIDVGFIYCLEGSGGVYLMYKLILRIRVCEILNIE